MTTPGSKFLPILAVKSRFVIVLDRSSHMSTDGITTHYHPLPTSTLSPRIYSNTWCDTAVYPLQSLTSSNSYITTSLTCLDRVATHMLYVCSKKQDSIDWHHWRSRMTDKSTPTDWVNSYASRTYKVRWDCVLWATATSKPFVTVIGQILSAADQTLSTHA